MKSPKNFGERIFEFNTQKNKIEVRGKSYQLGDSSQSNNLLWIYPKWNAPNVIRISFNWKEDEYIINIVRAGSGTNFHNTLSPIKIENKHLFKSFSTFLIWLESVIDNLEGYFDK